ncbi:MULTISPECIES: TRAP transporter small permease subunit [Halomonadaceae]|jgi:TRAP-type mannitol/chloroaromatic compound transport system permease small subunit|uniref:TRAP transporter small permease protein n=1 Tax=Vreelandella piezotolerans TaxID=2609667 RepID=A0ABQ6X8J2_9GAMM|nr:MULTISPECIES: TRAP transporter small permease subunit [Halomonas]KAE8437872.1 TRAP transporter small permease subunit [Halomonas piezotolerans]MCG7576326.1 TRAP transporter small permease subunit [Halomonas sp. MMH1-48]MCG7603389.1 TRAP transporter small permease subunit [Halomonas sp. MM17-34]MCG7612639.1 TRAP transporter small permease subunit [Halomonas sp. MM17-29]MCG7619795.1 TRAP transporter small permease subunit [Halomonas sp. DSH1-27]
MSDTTQLPAFIGALDRASEWFGRTLAWLIIIMMLIQFAIVLLRYMFSINSIFMQELVMYMHASVFMLAAAYTFRHDGHVRVDIFYRGMTPRRQALVNIVGILLLMIPVMLFVIASSYGYVANSWRIMETSSDYGGIPAVFALKTLIPVFAVLMILQGLIEVVRNGYVFTGRMTPPTADDNHLEERV